MSTSQAAAELYRMVSGQTLTEGEHAVLAEMLSEDADGKWCRPRYHIASEQPRDDHQLLEARLLAGLLLLDERSIIWSTYLYPSAMAAFRRVRAMFDGAEALRLNVKRASAARGAETIDLGGDRRVHFIHRRNMAAGRGLSADCYLLDEASSPQPLDDAVDQAVPSLAGRPNAQLVIAG